MLGKGGNIVSLTPRHGEGVDVLAIICHNNRRGGEGHCNYVYIFLCYNHHLALM